MTQEPVDWSITTWEGNRRQQREAFQRLSFREKVEALERMGEVADLFARIRPGAGSRPDCSADDRPFPGP